MSVPLSDAYSLAGKYVRVPTGLCPTQHFPTLHIRWEDDWRSRSEQICWTAFVRSVLHVLYLFKKNAHCFSPRSFYSFWIKQPWWRKKENSWKIFKFEWQVLPGRNEISSKFVKMKFSSSHPSVLCWVIVYIQAAMTLRSFETLVTYTFTTIFFFSSAPDTEAVELSARDPIPVSQRGREGG